MEIWKEITGYEGIYEISSFGNLRSIYRRQYFILKPKQTGYCVVSLRKNGRNQELKVHRIVAAAFIPNTENKPVVNHINGIKNDNRVENLEWVTHRENICVHYKLKEKTSTYTGVSFYKANKKWKSQIYINHKTHTIGYFNSQEEAHIARVFFEKENGIQNKYSK